MAVGGKLLIGTLTPLLAHCLSHSTATASQFHSDISDLTSTSTSTYLFVWLESILLTGDVGPPLKVMHALRHGDKLRGSLQNRAHVRECKHWICCRRPVRELLLWWGLPADFTPLCYKYLTFTVIPFIYTECCWICVCVCVFSICSQASQELVLRKVFFIWRSVTSANFPCHKPTSFSVWFLMRYFYFKDISGRTSADLHDEGVGIYI